MKKLIINYDGNIPIGTVILYAGKSIQIWNDADGDEIIDNMVFLNEKGKKFSVDTELTNEGTKVITVGRGE